MGTATTSGTIDARRTSVGDGACQAFVVACLRGTFARRFPELSHSEIKMKVLAYCTPIDLDYITSHVSGLDASVLQRGAELQEQAVADVQARPANTNTSERDDYA